MAKAKAIDPAVHATVMEVAAATSAATPPPAQPESTGKLLLRMVDAAALLSDAIASLPELPEEVMANDPGLAHAMALISQAECLARTAHRWWEGKERTFREIETSVMGRRR